MIGLLYLVLEIALVGFVVWLITTYIPMPAIVKTIIYVIVAIVAVLYVLSLISGGAPFFAIPHYHR